MFRENREVLVLGVGNPLQGDDGLGIRAAEMLAERDLPPGVRVEAVGTPGLGLATWLEGAAPGAELVVFIVDAVRMGQAPGSWRRLRAEELRSVIAEASRADGSPGPLSLHAVGLADGLALAQALGVLPAEVLVYGVEPASLAAGAGLSPSVAAALPGLVESILNELWTRYTEGCHPERSEGSRFFGRSAPSE